MAGVNKKSQQERALLQVMQREIERLEEERIQLKTENRKMAVQLGHKAAQLGLDAQDLKAIQEYRDALKERRRNMSKGKTFSFITYLPWKGSNFQNKIPETKQKGLHNILLSDVINACFCLLASE